MLNINKTSIKKRGENWSESELIMNNWIIIILIVYMDDLTYLIPILYSLCLAEPIPRVRGAWNLMGSSIRNGLRFFLLFEKKYHLIQKLSLLINRLLGKVFLTSGAMGLMTLLNSMRNSDAKKYFNSWINYFLTFH